MRVLILVFAIMLSVTAKADYYYKTKSGWVKVTETIVTPKNDGKEENDSPKEVFERTDKGPAKNLLSALGKAAQFVVNRDERAYQHALKEAKILAARGTAGHPLGCAPGTRYSGTGYSWSARPNHCFYGEMSESRLVARACVRGANGAYFWSAHYR